MRNFDERKTEIFRRSAERIRARKRKCRIVLICLPLMLCLVLLSSWFLSGGVGMESAEDAAMSAAENASSQDQLSGYILWEGDVYAPADKRETKLLRDPETVRTVIELLELEDGDFITPDQADKIFEDIIQRAEHTGITGNDISCSRTVTFVVKIVKPDGMSIVYRFIKSGNALFDDYHDDVIILTEEQGKQLKKLLEFYR